MKVLFIYRWEYVEPLGLMYLSSFLKKYGHKCYFIDTKFEKNIFKEVQKISPDIIAYSITTGKHKYFQKLNEKLKKRCKFFSFFGGPHATFFPELIYKKGVDCVCRGEGEYVILELVENLEKGKSIANIKNLWVKIKGKVYKNEVRKLLEDLDSLPFPDRELVNKYRHYRKLHRRFINTGRGCPYRCAYCFNHSYNKLYKNKGRIIRKRSVANVVEEMKLLKERYKAKRFYIVDDIFIIDRNWILEFSKLYKKEVNVPFIANIRANLVNEDVIKALKEARCITVQYGIETGNERLRNDVLKRDMSTKQIIEASKLINKYGIKSLCFNIMGFPNETLDMAFETVYLNIKCKPSYAWVVIFQPFPRTELCEYSMDQGYFNGDVDAIGDSYLDKKSVLKTKDIKKIERLRFLASLGVSFPILLPIIRILICLPLDGFYRYLWLMHRAWCYFFKVKLIDFSEIFLTE